MNASHELHKLNEDTSHEVYLASVVTCFFCYVSSYTNDHWLQTVLYLTDVLWMDNLMSKYFISVHILK